MALVYGSDLEVGEGRFGEAVVGMAANGRASDPAVFYCRERALIDGLPVSICIAIGTTQSMSISTDAESDGKIQYN